MRTASVSNETCIHIKLKEHLCSTCSGVRKNIQVGAETLAPEFHAANINALQCVSTIRMQCNLLLPVASPPYSNLLPTPMVVRVGCLMILGF